MSRNLKQIRNIGIIAHIDAGLDYCKEATVTERMLFYSNFVHKVGQVDQGTTVTDFDPEEQERAPYNLYSTIQAASVSFNWKDHCFNLIDTPGRVAPQKAQYGGSRAFAANPRRRSRRLQCPRRGRGTKRNRLAAGEQISCSPCRFYQQNGPRRGEFLRRT